MVMIPDLGLTSRRFIIDILNRDGTVIAKFMQARNPQFMPEISTVMFEDEDRIPTTVSNPQGIIMIRELVSLEEEELTVDQPSNILLGE